jgi:hypothetical protein
MALSPRMQVLRNSEIAEKNFFGLSAGPNSIPHLAVAAQITYCRRQLLAHAAIAASRVSAVRSPCCPNASVHIHGFLWARRVP